MCQYIGTIYYYSVHHVMQVEVQRLGRGTAACYDLITCRISLAYANSTSQFEPIAAAVAPFPHFLLIQL